MYRVSGTISFEAIQLAAIMNLIRWKLGTEAATKWAEKCPTHLREQIVLI